MEAYEGMDFVVLYLKISSLRPRTDLLLKEKESIESSIRAADESYDEAQTTRQSLLNQKEILARVGNNMSTMFAKLPVVNNLIGGIKNLQMKDMFVIAGVISVCLILIILYTLNK